MCSNREENAARRYEAGIPQLSGRGIHVGGGRYNCTAKDLIS